MRWLGAAGIVCSCSLLTNLDDLGGGGDVEAGADVLSDVVESDVEAGAPRCNTSSPFGTPIELTELADSSGAGEFGARLTGDELDVFYSHINTDATIRTYSAHRTSRTGTFGTPSEVAAVRGSGSVDAYPSVTADGMTYFVQSDSDGSAGFGIFTSFRSGVQFGPLELLATLDTPVFEGDPYVSPDGAELFFVRGTTSASPDQMIYSSVYGAGQFPSTTTPLQGVNAPSFRTRAPVITSDGLKLYFASNRKDGGVDGGDDDIWSAARSAPSTTFGSAELVSELATSGDDLPSWISVDECMMYLARKTNNTQHIFRAVRSP